MATYSIFAPNGELSRVLTIGEGDLSGNMLDGETCIPGIYSLHYVHEGLVLPLPTQPSPHHTFDYTTKQWIDPRTLTDLKAAKWAEIKRQRDLTEFAPLTYNAMVFDGDLDAQRRLTAYISVSKSAIAAGQPFSAEFTLADNTLVTLTAQDFVGIEMAKVQAVAEAFAHASALRLQIEAATSAAELDAVPGWPPA